MLELFIFYWPKLITAIWFSILNIMIARRKGRELKSIPSALIIGFFVSPSFCYIIGDNIIYYLYDHLINNIGVNDENFLLYSFLTLCGDALIIFIGGMLFTTAFNLRQFLGASIYMQYTCMELLSLLIAISYPTYVLVFFIIQCIIYIILRSDADYLFSPNSINWRRIFVYLIGLFYVLDILYTSYFIFPELGRDILEMHNVLWLDLVSLITTAFVTGYLKMCISEAREHDAKINYFLKFQKSQENIIITLTEISEAKSGETGQHVRRVAEYSRILAKKLNLSLLEVETIKIASMMHDLGKLMISTDIIEKPGQLSLGEFEIMKEHTIYGWEILSKSDGDIIEMARIIALQHHEHWDGNGYPNHLSGNQISIYAQIVAVADVFDALTSKRSYKDPWPLDEARAEIINQRGKHFSPRVVDAFMESYDAIRVIHDTYLD